MCILIKIRRRRRRHTVALGGRVGAFSGDALAAEAVGYVLAAAVVAVRTAERGSANLDGEFAPHAKAKSKAINKAKPRGFTIVFVSLFNSVL